MSDTHRRDIKLNIISAVDLKMGIGKDDVLPWHIPSEFRYFLDVTSNPRKQDEKHKLRNAVIVGRKTWDSMENVTSKPHPGALNIVLSRRNSEPLNYPNTIVCSSIDSVVELLTTDPKYRDNIDQVWVIGGTQVYRSALLSPHFHRLYLSRIKATYLCDSFFPNEFNEQLYERVSDDKIGDDRIPIGEQTDEKTGVKFEVCVYEKKIL
ncbi:hypothetical protein PR048_028248 [Dryococelus australis]|uniref:dihydrofolate reductase n=1 Tax=Dryococelus australis TaxID=614101 RepID=A0ABQ9GIQ4_9NEOP|nr:hypothetical protein PR048_028248 [Dryococelus australis]